jgi:hypothetical protein
MTPTVDNSRQTRNIIVIGVAIMLVLIGVATVIAALHFGTSSTLPPVFSAYFAWIPGVIAGIIGLIFVIILITWAFSWAFRPWGRPWRARRYAGWGWGWWGGPGLWGDDSAVGIIRERYARGEITKEQFDQMMRDLEEERHYHSGSQS